MPATARINFFREHQPSSDRISTEGLLHNCRSTFSTYRHSTHWNTAGILQISKWQSWAVSSITSQFEVRTKLLIRSIISFGPHKWKKPNHLVMHVTLVGSDSAPCSGRSFPLQEYLNLWWCLMILYLEGWMLVTVCNPRRECAGYEIWEVQTWSGLSLGVCWGAATDGGGWISGSCFSAFDL